MIIWLMQGLTFQSGEFDFNIISSMLNLIAMQLIIVIAAALSTSSENSLTQAFFVGWIGLLAVLIYGISAGGLTLEQIGSVRFSGAGFREVIWAEVALGTLALAILSRRSYAIFLTLPFSSLLIAASQMRTVGIAAVLGVLLLLYHRTYLQRSKSNRQIILLVLPIPIFLYLVLQSHAILQTLSTILLLDDAHRGITSGFSGRFDNIMLGWELFARSPIIGVGSLQEDATYVHNGYVKVLAQYGIFGLFGIALVGLSFWRAWMQRDYSLLAVILMLVLYYLGQPRHLSFQVFPFTGVLAVFLAATKLAPNSHVSQNANSSSI
ncbi:MAG: hypothetical protein GY768_16620 [Planctomycetaceae bacterium]|nr:hypothetical protein [Planctomycetaceae bacterium]